MSNQKTKAMKKTINVNITVRAIIEVDENISIGEVIQEMNYLMESQTEGAEIVHTEIREFDEVW